MGGHEADEGRQGHRLEPRGRRDPDRDDGHGLGSAGVAGSCLQQGAEEAAGEAIQRCKGPAEAGDRAGHVVDGIRRAVLPHDVCRQTDGGTRLEIRTEDKATVPIYYESRLAKLDINREEIDRLNKDVEEVIEDEEEREHRTQNVQH